MRNQNTLRIFLPLAVAGIFFSFTAPRALAQQSDGPSQGGPRPGGQRPGGPGGQRPGGSGEQRPGGPGEQRPGGSGAPDGQRQRGQGGPGMPMGPPAGFVPGDYLGAYLGLTGAQKQKLANLTQTLDVLNRDNFMLSAFTQLRLTEDEVRRIAAGDKLAEVLTAEQQQIMDANRRMDRRGGPGGPGGFGGPGGRGYQNGQGRPDGPGGRDGNPPPPNGQYGNPPPGRNRGNGGDIEQTPVVLHALAPGVTRIPVVFSGGHDTDPRDGGRPVVLVASALGVAPEIFREAFSHVRPARAGSEPEPEQVRQNKAALMNALGKYGIDNEQLDMASNYYRYVRSRNELWTNQSAVANALVKNGVMIGFEIVRGGAGYSSPPMVSVPNMSSGNTVVKLAFGKSLATNGSIASITLAQGRGGSL